MNKPSILIILVSLLVIGAAYYFGVYKSGGEKAYTGDDVTVHYTGTLENGEKFDSSRGRGQIPPNATLIFEIELLGVN